MIFERVGEAETKYCTMYSFTYRVCATKDEMPGTTNRVVVARDQNRILTTEDAKEMFAVENIIVAMSFSKLPN